MARSLRHSCTMRRSARSRWMLVKHLSHTLQQIYSLRPSPSLTLPSTERCSKRSGVGGGAGLYTAGGGGGRSALLLLVTVGGATWSTPVADLVTAYPLRRARAPDNIANGTSISIRSDPDIQIANGTGAFGMIAGIASGNLTRLSRVRRSLTFTHPRFALDDSNPAPRILSVDAADRLKPGSVFFAPTHFPAIPSDSGILDEMWNRSATRHHRTNSGPRPTPLDSRKCRPLSSDAPWFVNPYASTNGSPARWCGNHGSEKPKVTPHTSALLQPAGAVSDLYSPPASHVDMWARTVVARCALISIVSPSPDFTSETARTKAPRNRMAD